MADSVSLKLLKIWTDIYPKLISVYESIHGINCDVYYPNVSSQGMYGSQGRFKYSSDPDQVDIRYLILGAWNDSAYKAHADEFEAYFDESGLDNRPYILTINTKVIPSNSKIVAKFGGQVMMFRASDIMRAKTGASDISGRGNILIKQYLEPMT